MSAILLEQPVKSVKMAARFRASVSPYLQGSLSEAAFFKDMDASIRMWAGYRHLAPGADRAGLCCEWSCFGGGTAGIRETDRSCLSPLRYSAQA